MKIGVVIPVYNEAPVLRTMFERLVTTPAPDRLGAPCERVFVFSNDGSTDGSREIIDELAESHAGVVVLHAERNLGKGAALKTGFTAALDAGADLLIVQDADMEYDPADHENVLCPLLDGRADAVIGTRFLGQTHRVLYYWHAVANRVITTASNMVSNLNLTDVECGFKAFSARVARDLALTEPGFGVEIQIIAQLAKMRLDDQEPADHQRRSLRIYEVPVSYAGRTYAEGKKIGWRDGVHALWCVAKHNVFR